MFTNWKGRRPGGQDSNTSSSSSYPSSAYPTSTLSSSTISYPTSPFLTSTPQYSPPASANTVFGAPINPTSEGPPLLGKLVRFLQTKTATTENLFVTTPEIEAEVQVVKKNILRDTTTHPTALHDDSLQLSSYTKNAHVVAELLRLFLSSLPEPLLTFHLYDSFLLTQTVQSPADRVWAYRFLLAYLPPGFRASVKQLLTLLFNLSRNCEENGMDPYTLACVFGPYFLKPEEELYYMKDDGQLVVQIVALLIQEYESVLRAAPAAPPTRALPAPIQAVSSFPASPTSPLRKEPEPMPQLAHPLDQSVVQPAHLYEQPTIATKTQTRPASSSTGSTTTRPPPPALSGKPPPPSTKFASPIAKPVPLQSPAHASNPVRSPEPAAAQSPAHANPPAHASNPARALSPTPAAPVRQPSQSSIPTRDSRADSRADSRSDSRSNSPSPRGEGEETLVKLGRLRENVLMLLNDQITSGVMTLLSAIMSATAAGEAIEVSKALVIIKKFLSETLGTSLKAEKAAITSYLADHPRPPLSVSPPFTVDDVQLNKLRAAAYQATEQFMDLLFFLSSRMSEMTQPEDLQDAIAIAQIAKSLKSNTAEQLAKLHFPPMSSNPSTPSSTPSSTPLSTPLSTLVSTPGAPFSPLSPPTSPLVTTPLPPSTNSLRAQLHRSSLNTSASSLPTFSPSSPDAPVTPPRPIATSRDGFVSSIEKDITTSRQFLENISNALQDCGQTELVEFAKGLRFAKQRIIERVAELALGIDPDPRVEAVEGEDQLSALRRACKFNVTKLIELLDAIKMHVNSPGGQQMDPRPIAESMVVVSRALAKTCESM